mgnify:CR=1 FL=1
MSFNPVWINGVPRKDFPLLNTPENFLSQHAAWSIAYQQFFNCHPELDYEVNRNALGLYMLTNYQADPACLPNHVSFEFRNVLEKNARNIKSSNVALKIIQFFGNLIANILTLGIYGILRSTFQNRKMAQIEGDLREKREHIENVITRLKDLGQSIQNKYNEVEGRRQNIQNIQQQINSLKNEVDSLGMINPADINAKIAKTKQEISETEETLNSIFEEIARDTEPFEPVKEGEGKGWVPSAYPITHASARRLKGIKGVNTPALDVCETMPDLLRASFDVATKMMAVLTSQNFISFCRSTKIVEEMQEIVPGHLEKKHLDKIDAIYRFMAYLLIRHSELKRTGFDDAHLVLNSKGLTVSASNPYWPEKNKVFFKHHDDWTPLLDNPSNGVDPISVKYLLDELEGVDKNSIFSLILEPWTLSTSPLLIESKALKNGASAESRKLNTVLNLIADIASMFQRRYAEELSDLWNNTFNDRSAVLIDNTPSTVENNQEEEMKQILVWW